MLTHGSVVIVIRKHHNCNYIYIFEFIPRFDLILHSYFGKVSAKISFTFKWNKKENLRNGLQEKKRQKRKGKKKLFRRFDYSSSNYQIKYFV